MFVLVKALILFFSFSSSVLAGPHAISHGYKNTGAVFPRTAGLASGALDRSLYMPADKLQLLPIELPAETSLQGILTLNSTEAELCPHFALRDFVLTNPGKTRYSAPWRVACGVDFYGGDLSPAPVPTQDGPVGCAVICQRTSKCHGSIFWPSSDHPRSGDCYLKKTVGDPTSRPGFVAIVRRNDLKPNLALTTDERFFEGPRYDAIGDVFDIDTDDGEHHPHGKLFENYSQYDVATSASASTGTGAVVSTSFSSVSSSVTSSISSSASTLAQIMVSPIPIHFSTSPNSAAMPFAPTSSEVASSTRSTFSSVIVSTPTASVMSSSLQAERTLGPVRIDSVIAPSPTPVAQTLASAVLAESSLSTTRTTVATVSVPEPSSSVLVALSTSPWSTSLASGTSMVKSLPSLPVASPSRVAHDTDNEAEPSNKATSSFRIHMEGFSTDVEWKPAATEVFDSHESIRPTSSPRVYWEEWPTDVEPTATATSSINRDDSSRPTHSFEVDFEAFATGIESTPSPRVSVSTYESESSRPTSSFKVHMEGFPSDIEWKSAPTETSRPTVLFKVPIDRISSPTESVHGVEPSQATSSFEVHMEDFPTDIGRNPAPTASVTCPSTTSFKVVMEGFPAHVEWKSLATPSVAAVKSYQAGPLPSDIARGPTLIKLDATATQIPTKVTESLQSASSNNIYSSDGIPSVTGIPYACAMLPAAEAGGRVTLMARDVKTCGRLKIKRPLPITQSDDGFSQFLRDADTLGHTRDDEEAMLEFQKALDARETGDKATMLELMKALDKETSEEVASTSTLGVPESTIKSVGRPCSDPCDFMCDSDVTLSMEERLSRCNDWEPAQTSTALYTAPAPGLTRTPITASPVSTSTSVSISPSLADLLIPDVLQAQEKKLKHSIFFKPIEDVEDGDQWDVDDSEDTVEDDVESSDLELAPSAPATLTIYMVSTVSVGPEIVTLTRSAEPKTKPTVTRVFPVPEPSGSLTAHETNTIIDTAPTRLTELTKTLFVETVPAQATQTASCVQLGHSCVSMVVIFAPIATLEPFSKEGPFVYGDVATSTTVPASSSSSSPQPWPTRTLQVPENIIPTVNPITIPCEKGQPGDVDCNKFESIVMMVEVMPTMSLPEFKVKTDVAHKPIEHTITKSSGSQPAPTPSVVVPQIPPVNMPAPNQTTLTSSIAIPEFPPVNEPAPVKTSSSFAAPVAPSESVVAPTGWAHGPPLRPDLPPPFGEGGGPLASVSVAHKDKSSGSSSSVSNTASSHVSSATVVPINPFPSETDMVPISPLRSMTGVVPISPMPSGTGAFASSATLVPASTLATASSPKFSTYYPGYGYKPGMGDYSTQNPISAATTSISVPWLTVLVSLFAGTLAVV